MEFKLLSLSKLAILAITPLPAKPRAEPQAMLHPIRERQLIILEPLTRQMAQEEEARSEKAGPLSAPSYHSERRPGAPQPPPWFPLLSRR